jgi:creatinine amidohydrolase/Fe(II)-dependent formamide hydrolase-like protein
MSGSLYVPLQAERLRFGIGAESASYESVRRLYWLPFVRAFSIAAPLPRLGLGAALCAAAIFSLAIARSAVAAAPLPSVFIEDLTWPEVKRALAEGRTTAIYYAGSTEQNGPHMAIGKHNFIARYVAQQIAERLGDALVYPILPFAPTGNVALRTGHMRFPGSVSVPDDTFADIARDVAESAIAAGFRTVVLMGDHGGGQQALERVAKELDRKWTVKGVHVRYIGDLYYRSQDAAPGSHASIADTSELMAIDAGGKWIRRDQLAMGNAANGVEGDPRAASAEAGRKYLELKIQSAVAQIRAPRFQP